MTEAGPPALGAYGIGKSFGTTRALDDVSIALMPGEVHAVMGENGAGKSTLMKILTGIETSYEGRVEVAGTPVRFANVREAEAHGIAIIHQELNLVPDLSVDDNIFLGREPLRFGLFTDRAACRRRAAALLERLGIDLPPRARVRSLRVGEQQLVEIAKALSLDARVLVMDEPTSALSNQECERLFRIVDQLRQDGVAIAYISHRIDEVMTLADRVTVLRDGAQVMTRPMAGLGADEIIRAMVGRDVSGEGRTRPAAVRKPVLSVRGLTLDRPGRAAGARLLHGIDFDLAPGEILGIGGLLGAGRTELLEALFGAADGTVGGEIEIAGRKVTPRTPRQARALGLGLVTEDRKAEGLHIAGTITENVALPRIGDLSRWGVRGFAAERDLAQDAIRRLQIRCSGPGQVAGTLSGGNQQKVVIGKWLATAPRILLLDEPTRGIDVGAKREIYDLVFRLAEAGMALLVVTSEMPELLLLADRILVLAEGRQTGILDREEASEEAILNLATPRRAA